MPANQTVTQKAARQNFSMLELVGELHKVAKSERDWGIFVSIFMKSRGHSISLEYIEPGKPTQNAYVERFTQGGPS